MSARVGLTSVALLLALAGLAPAQQTRKAEPKPAAETQKKAQPPRIPPGVKVERDVVYGRAGDVPLKLDLYRPEESGERALPVVVWVHGGGWSGGSKDNCPAVGLTTRGYAVASVGYRLSDVATFPAQIEDCRAAIRWLRANAARSHLDPEHIGAWGASAGGHLVALLGTAGDQKSWDVGANLDQSSRVQAVCDYFGPADFTIIREQSPAGGAGSAIGRLLGGSLAEKKAEAKAASPITYVSKDDPPFLILHGDQDKLVHLDQSERLRDALKNAGADATLIVVKNGGHGFGPESDPPPREIQKTVFEFFERHLKGK